MTKATGLFATITALTVFCTTAVLAQAHQDELRLSAGDTFNLSVLNRPELSKNYRIRANGMISMHLIGEQVAGGLTETELEQRIEERIEDQTSLPASATIEVLEWRAITVAGDVTNPGNQTFEIGQTVAKAIALAGGAFPRQGETSGSSLDLRIAAERAEIQRREALLADLHARRIRLSAEASGQDLLESDPAFLDVAGPLAAKLLDAQSSILSAQRLEDTVMIESARRSAALSQTEIKALEGQQEILGRSVTESQAALERSEELLERGLSNRDRIRTLRITVNDENIQLMQASSFEARAQLQKAAAEASIEELRTRRMNTITRELYDVTVAIEGAMTSIAASKALIARVLPLAEGSDADSVELAVPSYRIRRTGGDGLVEVFAADFDTPLRPGDVIEVKRGGWLSNSSN